MSHRFRHGDGQSSRAQQSRAQLTRCWWLRANLAQLSYGLTNYGSYRIMSEAYNKTDKHFDERASSRGLLGGPFGGQCSTHEHQKTSDQF